LHKAPTQCIRKSCDRRPSNFIQRTFICASP
jgi:hypothetical protein